MAKEKRVWKGECIGKCDVPLQIIIGAQLHSRDFNNQQQEMMLGASILNRFTHLGMPDSYRIA